MAAVDVSNIQLHEFILKEALDGVPLFAKLNSDAAAPLNGEEEEESGDIYYKATNFKYIKTEVRFPYRATIEGTYYYFDENGVTNLGMFTLYCGRKEDNPISDTVGEDDISVETDPETGTTIYKNLSKLNSRESIALQALEALIESMPNPTPESYSSVTIKLLASKAFEFASEFLSQSLALRTGSEDDPSGGGEDEPDPESVLPLIPSESLNSLAKVKKIVWCTSYPAQGEDGTLYVKLRLKTEDDE